ncbi:DUF86 domain-containing protein [Halobacillus sp. A5]|uniref:DUF86 domain-containing protein n=1 Tax=Halobacillus sp. A5 TaxID=2880263 RepID=UPI0020A627E2|nr:DUF86 domain-containing protein [Halobacillus sp. A5]MCP3028265.1 DUF86 domain-containing protein [Halobacillus sp. A5]
MYFVNRQHIENILQYMEQIVGEQPKHSTETLADCLLLERITHVVIEAIIDTGNQMIDGFIMRDPGSYEDIIDILTDEKVLPMSQMNNYKEFIRLRKSVVQQYTTVNHQEIMTVWEKVYDILQQFPRLIREYLDEELGPVSAFTKDGVNKEKDEKL